MMSKPCLTCRHLLFVLLGLWLGMLLAVGAAAAVAFPTMKHLNPTLADFAAVGDHWSIAAGSIFQPIFGVAMKVLAGLAFASLVLSFFAVRGMKPLYRKNIVGWLFIAALSAGSCLLLETLMSEHWHAFIKAARAGDAVTAMPHRVEFERMHPTASGFLEGEAVLLGVIIVILLYGCRAKPQAEIAP